MNVVNDVLSLLSRWNAGGVDTCRAALIARHANIHDPDAAIALSMMYNTLLSATLKSWAPAHPLAPDTFVTFVVSVLQALPSSSSATALSVSSPDVVAFSEMFSNILWIVDLELDDTEAAASGVPAEDTEAAGGAATIRQVAGSDRDTLMHIVHGLMTARALDLNQVRKRVDGGMYAMLFRDFKAFNLKVARARTTMHYRQTKYNLLREQSEGFSKLITELIASLGPPPDPTTGRPVETAQEIQARAQATWNRLMGLVGFFDLDPNRTLDIILDVFTTYVATHWTFFVALLNCSPWAARTSRGPRVQGEMPSFAGKTFEEILTLAQEHAQGPVPPPVSGPRGLVAQLVGLKFRYYQQLDVAETAPKELALTAALLVREHFMTLEEIWVHLGEDDFRKADPAMDALRAAYDEDVKERVAAAKVSQLAMAAPLESADTSKPAKAKVAEPPKSKAEERKQLAASNQRVALVISLLSLGALRTALPVLSRYPWLVDAVPQVVDLLLELLAHSTSHLCAESRPGETKVQDKMDFSPPPNPLDAPEPDWTVSKARYGASGMTRLPPPKPQLTTILPVPLRTSTTYFVYFFADWANQIPVLKEWDDVIPVVGGFLSYLKVHAHRNTYFFHRLICLVFQHLLVAKAAAKELGEESPVRAFWFTMLRAHIIPAYSLLRGNAGCAVTLHSVLRHYEPTSRWPLYAEWKSTMMQSHPELRLRAIQVDRETKGILRRLSHETVDNLDGAIAKLTHHNPCIFFSHALNQVMAYSNLSTVLIKAFGRLTMLSFDVLYYLICDALANPNKERVKDDGVNLTDWLQNLSSFAAELGRRYATSELAQLLRYIVHQLYNRQTTEIVVLQDIIAKMAGIEPLPSLQDKQVAAMSGGPMLRIEAVASAQRGAAQNWNLLIPSSASKLSLYMTESSLATPLLVLVCQQRQACVFHASDTHLRSLSSLFDNIHSILFQFIDFLTSIDLRVLGEVKPSNATEQQKSAHEQKLAEAPLLFPLDTYASKVVPSLADLHGLYGIDASICMTLHRPIFNDIVLTAEAADAEARKQEASRRLAAAKAKGNAFEVDTAEPSVSTSVETTMEEVEMAVVERPSPWIPDLAARFSDIKALAPEAWEVMTPGFYMTFWQMTMYDLSSCKARYDEEIVKARDLVTLSKSKAATEDQRRNYYRVENIGIMLAKESAAQQKAYQFAKRRLAREKAHWFIKGSPVADVAKAVIEHCIQPRCLLSPMDADYCAEIIKVIHQEGTPAFYTLRLYDLLLGKHIRKTIFACSENEAQNYGRFLCRILSDLWKWFQDEAAFAADNYVKVAGKSSVLPGLVAKWASKDPEPSVRSVWENFKNFVKKWYRSLAKCFCACIETGEFMHVKNAVLVLQRISKFFPMAVVEYKEGPLINTAVESFLAKEEKGSLQVLCQSYHSTLHRRVKEWQPFGKSSTMPSTRPTLDRRESIPAGTSTPKPPSSLPSAPQPDRSSSAAPRPPIVKRVPRPSEGSASPATNGDAVPMDVDTKPNAVNKDLSLPAKPSSETRPSTPSRMDPLAVNAPRPTPVPSLARDILERQAREQSSSQGNQSTMPPPTAPSQTPTSYDLREAARATQPRSEDGRSLPNSPRPRRRSASPAPRGDARGADARSISVDSRFSGERATTDTERDDRRPSHRSQRYDEREREPSRTERDRDRGESGRQRDRDRDTRSSGKDRDDRERERESRDKDRESRDKDRDRSRREDKDRRDRKEREPTSRSASSILPLTPVDERDAMARADSRRRSSPPAGETTPKRRRSDEDGDRDPKRRRDRGESHREKDARETRHSRENRENRDDRRKDERDTKGRRDRAEGDERPSPIDRPSEKLPLPPLPPSAPRAMANADNSGLTPRQPRSDLPQRDRGYAARDTPPTRNVPSARDIPPYQPRDMPQPRDNGRDAPPPSEVPARTMVQPRRDPPVEREYGAPRGPPREYGQPRDTHPRGNGNNTSDYPASSSLMNRMNDPDPPRSRGLPYVTRTDPNDPHAPAHAVGDGRDNDRKRAIEGKDLRLVIDASIDDRAEGISEDKQSAPKKLKRDRYRDVSLVASGLLEKPPAQPRRPL